MANIFEELTSQRPKEFKVNSQVALSWFRNNIRNIFDRRKNETIYLDAKRTGKIVEGNMYMMFYNAKTKDKLPYYDRFPLVIPFDTRSVKNGFYGINLHYIHPQDRQDLLENLYRYKTADRTSGPTGEGVELRYEYIQSITRLKAAKPCVKRYLYGKILREPLQVDMEYWDVAAMLPTADFGKVNTNTVYAESRKKM